MAKHMYDLGEDFSTGLDGPDRSLLRHCLERVKEEDARTEGLTPVAVEFGTGEGHSTRLIAQYLPVITFDSFQGLPEDWRPGFPKGRFASAEEPRDIPGCTVVPGWFSDTLADYDWSGYDIALVHVDCDLYSSTRTALASVLPVIKPGCIIVFDEWFGYEGCEEHEQKAWRELAEPWIEWDVIGHGREQWAIQITKVCA